MRWEEFEREAGELASIGRRTFEQYELVALATIKLDGSPRLTLVAPLLFDDGLYVAAVSSRQWQKDLERDPRCSIQSLVSHRTHADRAFAADAVARLIDDSRRTRLLERASQPETSWYPDTIYELEVVAAHSVGGAPQPRLTWRTPT